ncbi:chloramphenicol phosphotransferase [Devosia pacifica]|uniref:Chloramphenicol phosphotransferase n=1 Tax=Devosia pacifica TaxID=1335967 RepID=A0A918S4F5_9HYPH|nr:chloramphenicol phosphotransferase [Devosia pacifica]GHA23991.1 chloramphenicol phosphotransferase [Devosia pacifica]
MQRGRIVILDGPPRSGKSSLAAAIQQHVAGAWINLGVDLYNAALPKALLPGIGLRPGGERPDLEPMVLRLYQTLFDTIALHAHAGFNVVADLGIHDFYATPLNIAVHLEQKLAGLSVLMVGVTCADEINIARRTKSEKSATQYAVDPAIVARWREAVAAGKRYDLVIDTGTTTPETGAMQIDQALAAKTGTLDYEA